MTRTKEKNWRRGRKNIDLLCCPASDDAYMAREKDKARKLRDSAWWRKKSSSGICAYCGMKFQPGDLTMDHVIPVSRGGTSEKFNIVPCCKGCNNKKRYLLPAEWEEYIESIKNKK